MKALIVEDDPISRRILQDFLSPFADCETVENGEQAIEVFKNALDSNARFQLVCLDIMMPKMDGHQVLKLLRNYEQKHGVSLEDCVKIVMTTALEDYRNVIGAFGEGCSAYIVKPINKKKLLHELQKLGFAQDTGNS